MQRFALTLVAILLWLLTGCAGAPRTKADELTATLRAYEGAVRWGSMSEAIPFLDAKALKAHPISQFELDRYAQFAVAGYRTQTDAIVDQSGVAHQQVLIELVNKHTQSPRTILDAQSWQFDKQLKRWVLLSGLPKLDNVVEEP